MLPGPVRLLKLLVLGVVVLVVVAVVALDLVSRYVVQRGIVDAVKAKDPSAQNVSASVSLPLLYTFVTQRRIDRVTVLADQVDLGPVVAAHVTAVATGVHLRVPFNPADLSASTVQVTGIDRIALSAEITDAEMSATLPAGFTFTFGDGTATVHTPFGSVTVKPHVTSPGHIGFTLAGSPLAGLTTPELSLSAEPLSSCLDDVALSPGELTVDCAEDNPPASLLPTVHP